MPRVSTKYNLKDKNVARRRASLLSLQSDKSKKNFKTICEAIKKDPSAIIRHEAAFLLGTWKNEDAIAPLIDAVENDSSDLVIHEAIEALGDLGIKNQKIEKLLANYKNHPEPIISESALVAFMTLN